MMTGIRDSEEEEGADNVEENADDEDAQTRCSKAAASKKRVSAMTGSNNKKVRVNTRLTKYSTSRIIM